MKKISLLACVGLLYLGCNTDDPSTPEVPVENEAVEAVHSPEPSNRSSAVPLEGRLSFTPGDHTSASATYKLYIDTNQNPTTAQNLGGSAYYDYSDLQPNTTYYWKVATLEDNVVEVISPVWQFETIVVQPVNIESPSHQSTSIALNGSISFSPGQNTPSNATFRLFFGTDQNPTASFDLGTNTTYSYSDLSVNTNYYWKVETLLDNRVVARSDIWKFTTERVINSNAAPSENFDLSTWKLTLPISRSDDPNDSSLEISVSELNNQYSHPEYFYTADDGGMVFRCPPRGATTSANTSYVRTELREMLRGTDTSIPTQGVNGNNWVFGSAPQADIDAAGGYDGHMEATLAINEVTTTGNSSHIGRVVIGQIHANDDEPIRVYYRKLPNNDKGTIYFAHEPRTGSEIYIDDMLGSRSSSASNPSDGIALNERFTYVIDVVGNQLTFTLSRAGKADIVRTVDMSNSGFDASGQYMYFKAGIYVQNNTGNSDDFTQATFYRLEKSHSR